MGRKNKPYVARLSSPAFARALIAIAAASADRAALIGDLEEEFAQRQKRSGEKAQAWYWRQAALSTPHLIISRLRSPGVRQFILTAAAAIAAYMLVRIWDVFVARSAAQGFYRLFETESFGPTRIVYLLVQATGYLIAGAGIAWVAFDKRESLMKNFASRLFPTAAVLFAPALISQLAASDAYSPAFRLLQMSVAALAFGTGAFVMARFLNRAQH